MTWTSILANIANMIHTYNSASILLYYYVGIILTIIIT